MNHQMKEAIINFKKSRRIGQGQCDKISRVPTDKGDQEKKTMKKK